jgi:ornithine carbamoyltransferase
MQSNKCTECGNETYEKDCICALCKKNITQMHEELIELLKKDKEWKLRENKIRLRVRDKCIAHIFRKSILRSKVSTKGRVDNLSSG